MGLWTRFGEGRGLKDLRGEACGLGAELGK